MSAFVGSEAVYWAECIECVWSGPDHEGDQHAADHDADEHDAEFHSAPEVSA